MGVRAGLTWRPVDILELPWISIEVRGVELRRYACIGSRCVFIFPWISIEVHGVEHRCYELLSIGFRRILLFDPTLNTSSWKCTKRQTLLQGTKVYPKLLPDKGHFISSLVDRESFISPLLSYLFVRLSGRWVQITCYFGDF